MPTDANGFEIVEAPEQDAGGLEAAGSTPRDNNGFEIVQPVKHDANGFEVVEDNKPEPAFFTGLGHTLLAFPGQVLKGAATVGLTRPGFLPGYIQPPEEEQNAVARAAMPAERKREEIVSSPVFQKGMEYSALAPQVTPEEEASKWTRAGETIGGFAPAVMGPLAPVGMGLQAVGEHITSDFDNAKQSGADDETAAKSAMDKALLSGGFQGATFALMPPALRTVLEKYVVGHFGQAALSRWFGGRVAAAAEGAAIGTTSQAGENVIEGQPLLAGTGGAASGLAAVNLLLPWLREHGATGPHAEPVGETPTPMGPAPAAVAVPEPAAQRPLPGQALLDEARAQREAETAAPQPAAAADLQDLQAEMQRNQIMAPASAAEKEAAAQRIAYTLAMTDDRAGEVGLTIDHYVENGTLTPAEGKEMERRIKSGELRVSVSPEELRYQMEHPEAENPPPSGQPEIENAAPGANGEAVLAARAAKPPELSDFEKAELQRQLDEELGQAAQPGEGTEAELKTAAAAPASDVPLEEKQSAQAEGGGTAPTLAEPERAVKRVGRGLRTRKIFDRETEMNGPDILSWINDNMRLLSKTGARKLWGAEKFSANQSLWDDAPVLQKPHHNVIYSPDGLAPDRVAEAAYRDGALPEPGVNALWAAIEQASKARSHAYEQLRRHEKILGEEAEQAERWRHAKVSGEVRVDNEELRPGDVMEIQGERVKVTARDPDSGDITLEDGSKFGKQTLPAGDSVYVEKLSDDLVDRLQETPPKESPGIDSAAAAAQAAGRERNGNRQAGPAEIPGREQPGELARRNAAREGEHAGAEAAAAEPAGALQSAPAEAQAAAAAAGSDAAHLAYLRRELDREVRQHQHFPLDYGALARSRAYQGELDVLTGHARPDLEQLARETEQLRRQYRQAPQTLDHEPTTELGANLRAQLRYNDGVLDAVLRLREASKEAGGPRSALEQWAEKTIAGSQGRLSAGLDPAVLAAHAVKGAFLLGRGVRDFAAWSAEMLKDLGEAIKPHLPEIFRESLQLRREEITERLGTIATQMKRPGGLTDELKSQRYQLAKESRELGREQAKDPAYVADLLRRMDKLGQAMDRSRKAGNGLGVREAGEELRGLMEGDLQQVDPKLLNRVYSDLVNRREIAGTQLGELPAGRTLGELATWVGKQLRDSPNVPLAERFNLAQQAADKFSRGKDAVMRMADRVSAKWEAFKENYRWPTPRNDFQKTTDDWFYEKQETGLDVERWLQAIKRAVPNKVRRSGISVWLDAGGDRAVLQSQLDLVPARFKRFWQAALNLTPGELNIGNRIRAEFEGKLDDAKTLGLLLRGREDYGVPQVWSTVPKNEGEYDPFNKSRTPRRMGAKLDPRDPFFSLERKNASYFDGIMLGGVPKDLDIANLVGVYNAEFHNSLADRGVIKALKDNKEESGDPTVMISGGAHVEPRGAPGAGERTYFVDSHWRPKEAVTSDGRPYRFYDHWALKDWKFASRDAEGNPIIVHGDFLIHPDRYAFLANELGKSWLRDPDGGGKYFNWVLDSAAFLKASKFASATFHMATLGEHAMFHAVMPIWRPGHGPELDPARNPKLAGLMRQGGMDLGFGGQRALFEEGNASHGGIFAHVPGLGDALGRMSDFLFKEYFPKLKAKVGLAVLERNLARYKDQLSEDQIYDLTGRQMNAAFGGQNWKRLGTNKTLMDVNRLLLTAPDFFVSRAKVVAQALKPYNAEQRYFLLAQAALVYTAARALNMLFNDGDPHWEWQNALSVVYKGRAYSARFLVNDIYHLATDPMSFAQGRLGPLPRAAYESVTQRDMRTGARITVPFETTSGVWRSAQVLVKDLAQWLVPVGAEGLLPGAKGKEDTGPSQVALALAGVGSRKYTAQTEVYQWAKDFNRNGDQAAQLYQQGRDAEARGESAYRKLDALLDAGETKQASAEYQSLLAEGHKPLSVATHYDRMAPFTGSAARELKFTQQLSPTDNRVYQRALQERRDRLAAFQAMLRQAWPVPATTP